MNSCVFNMVLELLDKTLRLYYTEFKGDDN